MPSKQQKNRTEFFRNFLVVALFLATLSPPPAYSANTPHPAILGFGYNSDTTMPTNQSCFTGHVQTSGTESGNVELELVENINDIDKLFRFQIGIGGTINAFVPSVSLEWRRTLESNALEKTFVYRANYRAPSEVFVIDGLNESGEQLKNNAVGWMASCGDQYVSEHEMGAELLISVKIKFKDILMKKEFEKRIGFGLPFLQLSIEIENMFREYNSHTDIQISALQLGGNPNLLGEIIVDDASVFQDFLGFDNKVPIINCNAANASFCAKAMEQILAYAGTTFAENAGAAPTMIRYNTHRNLYAGRAYPIIDMSVVSDDITAERNKIHRQLDRYYAEVSLISDLESFWKPRLTESRLLALADAKTAIENNIALLQNAGFYCYAEPATCLFRSEWDNLQVYDPGVIETPTALRLDYQAGELIREGADISWGPEVSCGVDLPDAMNAVITGWGSSVSSANVENIGIQFRSLRANGTLGEPHYRMCGSSTDLNSLERSVFSIPEDRVAIATSYAGRYRGTLGIGIVACTLDTVSGRINTSDCREYIDGESSWLEAVDLRDYADPRNPVDAMAEHYLIREIGLNVHKSAQHRVDELRLDTVPLVESQPAADLKAELTGEPGYRSLDGNIEFVMGVYNRGPQKAEHVVLTGELPAGVALNRLVPDQECSQEGQLIRCEIAELGRGVNHDFRLSVQTEFTEPLDFSVNVTTATEDPLPANNSITVALGGSVADLTTTLNGNSGKRDNNTGNINFVASVVNHGPHTAQNTVLFVTLPAGVSYISSSEACSIQGQIVQCPLGNLDAAAPANVEFTVNTPLTEKLDFFASAEAETKEFYKADNTDKEQFGGALGWLILIPLLSLLYFRNCQIQF